MKNAILIAGPTASGKSALALDLAERTGGVIVNADSMQVYSVLEVLTARPGPAELLRARHHLYGHVPPSAAYSTGAWLRDAARIVDEAAATDSPAIFVGGTGLYFRALTEGMSEMPHVALPVREHWREMLREQGPAELHRILAERDPAAAKTLKAGDSQRLMRALEVLDASGRSILEWQAERGQPLIDMESAHLFVIEPDRADLVQRIDRRFDMMIQQGALVEVKALCALGLDPALPAMKAIGVRELQMAMAGRIGFPEAVERAKIATRQYAKRQATWFRHQLDARWTSVQGADKLHLR